MNIEDICKEIGNICGQPCDYECADTPIAESMIKWCEKQDCGKVPCGECWLKYFETKFSDNRYENVHLLQDAVMKMCSAENTDEVTEKRDFCKACIDVMAYKRIKELDDDKNYGG